MTTNKPFPWKQVVLVAAAAAVGLLVGRASRKSAPMPVPIREAVSLPSVEVMLDGNSLGAFLYAKGPRDRTDAWLQWVTASGRGDHAQRVVLEWEEAGRFAVTDVPQDMAIVWVRPDGVVVGSTESPGGRTNLVLPTQVVLRALLMEKGSAPAAGGRVTILVKQAVP